VGEGKKTLINLLLTTVVFDKDTVSVGAAYVSSDLTQEMNYCLLLRASVELHSFQHALCNLARVRITVRVRVRFMSENCKLHMHNFEITQRYFQTGQPHKLCAALPGTSMAWY